jgi:long-chain fatty acid transport protein
MRIVKGLAVILVVVFSAASASAAGFRLPMGGAKAMGMGFAFTAQADDPSAIYFNPAGITQLDGMNLMVGATYVRENGATFTGTTPISGSTSEVQKDLNFLVPNAYFTRKASPYCAYGIGIFSPFGLGQEYKDRNASIFRSQVTKIDLKTVVVNPTVAFKIGEVLSIGAGIDFMYGKAELAKTPVGRDNTTLALTNIYNLDLEGDGTAWSYNFGILLTPSKNTKVGFSYRGPFSLEIKDGDVNITNVTSTSILVNPAPPPFTGLPPQAVIGGASYSTKAKTTINMPATASLGLAMVFDKLTLEADADMTFWHSYRSLVIDIAGEKFPFVVDSTSAKNWKDVVAYRVGGEYRVTNPLALRLGFAYDPTPVPANTMSPDLPDADRLTYHAGVGYKVASWTIDAAYYYVDKKDRTVFNQTSSAGFNGKWEGDGHLVGVDVSYRF